MTNSHETDSPPSERVKDVARVVAAFRRAVREALIRHKKLGNSVAVCRDGQVVVVPAEEIPDYENLPDEASE